MSVAIVNSNQSLLTDGIGELKSRSVVVDAL
jgi:hypothetical protein